MTRSRSSGVLLHPTSLPGPHGSGDLGPAAYHFVDWLVAAGQRWWQMLPVGEIGLGHSPYMSPSAQAGNALLLDLGDFARRGWLAEATLADAPEGADGRIDFERLVPWRLERVAAAAAGFDATATVGERAAFAAFCQAEADWLEDYVLFRALSARHPGDWMDWPAPLAAREPAALAAARGQLAEALQAGRFAQWQFAEQWARLRAYAHRRGVRLIGDAPIFVAQHSADVWVRRELFELGGDGRPTAVAGVPPDFFSATGQRWGNPLYRWDAHAAEGYGWWIARLRRLLTQFDRVRIDHFRGLEAYWAIPADEPTAMVGAWQPGPGAAFFEAVRAALGGLPLIAEDLGIVTPEVLALRRRFGLPGMLVLQFAWGEWQGRPCGEVRFLPHRHEPDHVVYPGTHDNDTCVGWWASIDEPTRHHVREYLASDGRDIAWDLIRTACLSVADLAIHALPDVLALDGRHRMNVPGQPAGNWGWRFDWRQVQPWHAERLRRLCQLGEREPPLSD